MKRISTRYRLFPAWVIAVLDIFLLCLLLGTFLLYYYFIPQVRKSSGAYIAPPATLSADYYDAWRARFAEHFSAEPVITPTTYKSANISIEITRHEAGGEDSPIVYYVADIYLADIKAFQTALAGDTFSRSLTEPLEAMAGRNAALLAMTGDCYGNHAGGITVRNGMVHKTEDIGADVCILYYDGVMSTVPSETLNIRNTLEAGAYQIWVFGPRLLDDHGQALTRFNASAYIQGVHPRAAIGYYEPGHYCFVVVDGRLGGYSNGADLHMLASIFESLGCKAAYNMDGGRSAEMLFNGDCVNSPHEGGRPLTDCIIIKEVDAS